MWGEWFVYGPLLIFFIVSMVDKDKLNRTDWTMMTIIIYFILTILFGFLQLFQKLLFGGYFWFFLASLSFFPTPYLPWYVSLPPEFDVDVEAGVDKQQSIQREQRFCFAAWLTFSFLRFHSSTCLPQPVSSHRAWGHSWDIFTNVCRYERLSTGSDCG